MYIVTIVVPDNMSPNPFTSYLSLNHLYVFSRCVYYVAEKYCWISSHLNIIYLEIYD